MDPPKADFIFYFYQPCKVLYFVCFCSNPGIISTPHILDKIVVDILLITESPVHKFQELAGIIKLSAYSSFSLFECRKAVVVSKSPDPGNGTYINCVFFICVEVLFLQFLKQSKHASSFPTYILITFCYILQRSILVQMIINTLEIYSPTLRHLRTGVKERSCIANLPSKRSYFESLMRLLQTQCLCSYHMFKYVSVVTCFFFCFELTATLFHYYSCPQ